MKDLYYFMEVFKVNKRQLKKKLKTNLSTKIKRYGNVLEEASKFFLTQEGVDHYNIDPFEYTELLEATSDSKKISSLSIKELQNLSDRIEKLGEINLIDSPSRKFTIFEYQNAIEKSRDINMIQKGSFEQNGGLSGNLNSDEMYALIQEYNKLVKEGAIPSSYYLLDNYNAAAGLMEQLLTPNEIKDLTSRANKEREEKIRKRQEESYKDIILF